MSHVALKRALTILSLAGVAWLSVFAIGRTSALQAARQTIADQKEENAAKVEAVYRLSRELITAESLKVVKAERALAQARRSADKALDSAESATASSMSVLQDSAATVPQLRGALVVQVATTERVSAAFRAYLMSDSTYHEAERVERIALYRSLTLADSTIVAKSQALDALRKVGSCTIVWRIKCPTRTSTFVLGALATGAVVIALR